MSNKTKDNLYLIFMGLLLYISGGLIIAAIRYFINRYVGIDFITIVLYYFGSVYITKLILNNIYIRNKFVTVYLCIMTAIMYLISRFAIYFILALIYKMPILNLMMLIPGSYVRQIVLLFSMDTINVDTIFQPIVIFLSLVIEVLIMIVGIVQCRKVTWRE